jgi:hypothetical protein
MTDSPYMMHGRNMFGLQLTPQATVSQPKVVAEFVSLGPAAVLQDRNAAAVRPNISPSRFSVMHESKKFEIENSLHINIMNYNISAEMLRMYQIL